MKINKPMKKYLITLCLVFITMNLSQIYGQIPGWAKYESRQAFYPEKTYFIGFSSEINYSESETAELLEKCKDNAKKTLIESVQVSIKSVTVSGINSANYKNNPETYEYIKHSSVSYSNVDIAGLVSETYYDKKKKTAYAFTYVKKPDLINLYKQKVDNKLQSLEQMFQYAEESKKSGQSQKAFEKLVECLPVFRELEEAQSILAGMGVIDEASIKSKKTLELKSKVDKSIDEINTSAKNDISDLAYFIANGLKIQKPELKGTIGLSNFTYQDTKMGSPFSKRLNQELEQKLISIANYNIQNKENAFGGSKLNNFDYLITGTYWEEGDYLKIIVVLRDFNTGKAEASIESKLSKNFCTKNNIQFLPENFINAEIKNKTFSENEIVGGDLSLEIWTNKGTENLMYSESDTLRLYLRTNKECYVRFIYYLADGSSVLLLDDFYIGIDKVNKVYQLPDEFVCASPYGVEVLQVNAQTEKFEPLLTKTVDGYRYITDDLAVIIEKNRGFKKLDNNKVLKSEKRMIFTTMAY
jgi:hypothetical protein